MTEWRRRIHANPATAFEEVGTARHVVGRLKAFGVDEIHEGIATTGVVAAIRGRSGKGTRAARRHGRGSLRAPLSADRQQRGRGGAVPRGGGARVGETRVSTDKRPAMDSVDFARMLRAKPGAYMRVGNGTGTEGGCMVHDPGYDFNDAILPIGAAYWVRLVETALAAE